MLSQQKESISTSIFGFTLGVVSTENFQKGIKIGVSVEEKTKNKISYDSANDPRLGSAVFNDKNCKTCNCDFKECVGHFGQIELKQPLFNPIFRERVQNILQLFCLNCFQIMIKNYKNFSILKLLQKSKHIQCQNCGEIQPKVKIVFKEGILETQLFPKQIKKLQQHMQKEVYTTFSLLQVENFLNQINFTQFHQIFNVTYKPIDLIFSKCFPIPPPHIRAQLNQTLFTQGKAFQNQLSQLYQQVIKNIQQNQYKNASQLICEIFGVLTDINKQYNPVSFKSIIDKKKGIIRLNVCQKRICNAGRTVLGASPDLKPNQVQIPIYILKQLSIAVQIDEFNIKQMQKLLENENQYPGLTYVLRGNDKYNNKQIKQLQIGDIVGKNPQLGDYCLLSRQPILHLYSINYMQIVPGFENVLRINNSVSNTYAADFDGDEMNIFVIQNKQIINGAKMTLTFESRCTNIDNNNIIFVPNHDTPFGLFIFTKYLLDKEFTFQQMQFLLQKTENQDILKYKKTYSGYEIWDYIFAKDMKQYKNIIPITNSNINFILTEYYYKFGARKTLIFLQNLMQFSFQVVSFYSLTLTIQQTQAKLDFVQLRKQYNQIENECQKLFITNLKKNEQQNLLQMSEKILISDSPQNIWTFYNNIQDNILSYFDKGNNYVNMIQSGSKGKLNHLSTIQHTGMLNFPGSLFDKIDNYRFCCYNAVMPCGLSQNNCVFDGLNKGISLQSDYLSTIIFSRDGFVTQKTKTNVPGYLNRKNDTYCSTITTNNNYYISVNNQMILNTCFAGNNVNLKYQKMFNCQLLKMSQEQIKMEFDGCSAEFIEEIQFIKKKILYCNLYSNFNLQQIFNKFRFPIVISYILEKYDKQLENTIISPRKYEMYLNNFFREIKIVTFPQNAGLEKMNEDKKVIFKICFLSQLSYKFVLENKIDEQCFVFILIESMKLHEQYKIQSGEFVGLQCCQAFSKEVTQQAISSFHQTKVQLESVNIDWVEQLQKYLYIGSKTQLYYKLKFREPYNKDITYFKLFEKILKKIPFLTYYQNTQIGIDIFEDSPNNIKNFVVNDCILLKKQHLTYLAKYQPFDVQEITQFQFFVNIFLNQVNMKNDEIEIDFIIYSISNFIIQKFVPICDVYLLKHKDSNLIQLRFNVENDSDIENIQQFFTQQINQINISIFEQQFNIEKLEIKKEKYFKIKENGDLLESEEYVFMIYDQIPKSLFENLLQYSEIIDFNRSYNNDLKQAQKNLSIIQQQRLLYFLINEAHQKIIKHENQIVQSVALISQIMTHQKKMIPIFRFGISKIQGSDPYFQASFETQFQNLVKGGVFEDFGSCLNNYTNYMLNSQCQTGSQKFNLILSKDKQQPSNIQQVKVPQKQIFENAFMGDVIQQESQLKIEYNKQNIFN